MADTATAPAATPQPEPSAARRRLQVRRPAELLWVLDDVVARTAFRHVDDAAGELRKINFIRVYIGLVLLLRTYRIAATSGDFFPADGHFLGMATSSHAIEAWAMVALAGLFTVGIATPLVTAALLYFYPLFDMHSGTHTLGTLVLSYVLTFMLLCGAGASYSVDGWLLRRGRPRLVAALTRRVYSVIGVADRRRMQVLLFLLFLAYSLSTLSAVLVHIQDPFWQNGGAIGAMLTSSFFSRLYAPARWLEEHMGGVMHVQNVLTDRLQIVWELFMVPLMWFRTGAWLVVTWGTVFIAMSILTVQLSYLPFIEAGMWAMLFVRPRARSLITILYDDRCNLCRRAVSTLRVLNPRQTYVFAPLSQNQATMARHGLGDEQVQENIHGVFGDRVYVGYALYELIARRNPVLWVVYPFLVLGRHARIGPAAYAWVARNRRRVFGTCAIAAPHTPSGYRRPRGLPGVPTALIALWIVAMAAFVIEVPQVRSGLSKVGLPYHRLPNDDLRVTILPRLGFEQPDVFNAADLRSGDSWAVLTRIGPHRPNSLVPYTGRNGQRLSYHQNDLIYYGLSIPWRRISVGVDLTKTPKPGTPAYDLLNHVARYDMQRQGIRGPERYRVQIYRSNASDFTIDAARQRFVDVLANTYTMRVP